MQSLRACLRRGMGLTLCPRVAIAADLAAGSLCALPWSGFEPEAGRTASSSEAAVLMIWHADKWCSPLLTRFMDLSAEVMGRT